MMNLYRAGREAEHGYFVYVEESNSNYQWYKVAGYLSSDNELKLIEEFEGKRVPYMFRLDESKMVDDETIYEIEDEMIAIATIYQAERTKNLWYAFDW